MPPAPAGGMPSQCGGMALSLDPEVAAGLAPLAALAEPGPLPPAGDWRTRRDGSSATFWLISSQIPPVAGVTTADHVATAPDGGQVPLRWYTPDGRDGDGAGPAALFIHGGGMILGSVDLYDQLIRSVVAESGVPALAVDYRLAPEHPHPVPVEDCYAGLVWLAGTPPTSASTPPGSPSWVTAPAEASRPASRCSPATAAAPRSPIRS